jgi:hypothetical protein
MKADIKNKTVPWPQLQAYSVFLDKHHISITRFMKLKDEGHLDVEDLERKTPLPILQMYDTVSKIVTDNGIVKQEEEKVRDKIEFAMKTAVNLQTTLMA